MTMTDYRRALVLYVLSRLQRDATSHEVAEAMIGAAQAEGHPEACWRGITPASAAAHLRQFECDHAISRGEGRPNRRNGKPDPTWRANAGTAPTMPPPPEGDDVDVPVAARAGEPQPLELTPLELPPPEPVEASPYDDMTRDELIATCIAQDEVLQALQRADRVKDATIRSAIGRMKARLADAGLVNA